LSHPCGDQRRSADGALLGMAAVILNVGFRAQSIRDFFLRTRRDGLVLLEFGDGRLVSARDVLMRWLLVVEGHGGSFGR
jgi:hypothetical protein